MRKSRLSLDEAKEKYPDWYEAADRQEGAAGPLDSQA